MNKKTHKIGLIVIALTLLIGCGNANTEESNVSEVTDASEEMSTEEKANNLEESYWLRTDHRWGPSQDYGVFQVDNETPYEELITKTVDIHEFAQWFVIGKPGRGIDDVMHFMGVECLRETEAGALYSIHKVEQGGLLYIFYLNHDWYTEIRTNGIRGSVYVRERLSYSDFDSLQANVSTIEDVIKINVAEQIYLNCYNADPMFDYDETMLFTYHYLEDGIGAFLYELIDGELVFTKSLLMEDFEFPFTIESRHYPYDARILEMDWVE